MNHHRLSPVATIILALAAVTVLFTLPASAQTPAQFKAKATHQFTGVDGIDPSSSVFIDASGNIFGTAQYGGTSAACLGGCGVVFELSPAASGGMQYRVIHNFAGGNDGASPRTTLIQDAHGNLYGTTMEGGSANDGTVFELTPTSTGHWQESVLHRFLGLPLDGRVPIDTLAMDARGNLYGVTSFSDNGTPYIGEVFELSPPAAGSKIWSFKNIHNFQPGGSDGDYPITGVVIDATGNLYGNTQFGGGTGCFQQGCGVIYELSPGANGQWTENILYAFPQEAGNSGSIPSGRIALDSQGDIYGTTEYGGEPGPNCPIREGCGTTFELFNVNGVWQRKTLHFFGQNSTDGQNPFGPVTLDSAGNLYGTTIAGGDGSRDGMVYRLSPTPSGWDYAPLHSFVFFGGGVIPWGGVVPDAGGNLWGTTYFGGINQGNGDGYGVVFELSPAE